MSKRNRGAHLIWLDERSTYYIRWFEAGRLRKKATGTTDRKQAEQALQQFLVARDQPIETVSTSTRNVSDVLSAYAEEHAVHVASATTIGFNIKALIPFWGNRVVSEVRPTLCREYAKYRKEQAKRAGKTLSDTTIARELGVLATAINHDFKQGRIPNPMPVWKPAQAAPKDRWLTRSEVAKLLKAARERKRINKTTGRVQYQSRSTWHLAFFILLGLYTAARKEAILQLRWPQVDMQQAIIDFNPPGTIQTNKRRAKVPIPRRLMTFLKIARARSSPDGFVIEYFGMPIQRIDKTFARIADYVGMPEVTPHTLRHTAATWMAQADVPMWQIAQYLGHTSTRTTERVYAHHCAKFLVQAKEALENKTSAIMGVPKNEPLVSPKKDEKHPVKTEDKDLYVQEDVHRSAFKVSKLLTNSLK